MTAHDQMQTGRALSELLVVLITDVRESCNPGDVGRLFDEVDCVLHGFDGIGESRRLTRTRDVRCGLSRDANDGKLKLLIDVERLDGTIENGMAGLDIGRNDGESEVLQEVPKHIVTAIEFMVSCYSR